MLPTLPAHREVAAPCSAVCAGLLAQCVAAPLLAAIADRYGARRLLMTAHVIIGLCATVAIGLAKPTTPVLTQAFLVATLYYAMALAWMFQNALLPSVAPVAKRPTLSLASTALSNLGGALFLLLQYRALSTDEPADLFNLNVLLRMHNSAAPDQHHPQTVPVGTGATAVVAAAAAHAPSVGTLHLVCLLAAAWWALSALPAIMLMSLLKAEPIALPLEGEPQGGVQVAGGAVITEVGVSEDDQARLAARSWGLKEAAGAGVSAPTPRAKSPPLQLQPSDEEAAAGGGGRRRRRGLSMLSGIKRLRRHKHASRFVLAQVLYLTASVADGTAASSFAREVVGLDITAIIRLTIFAALAGAVGSVATMGMARYAGARLTLGVLMVIPPLLLLYTSLVLVSEEELLVVGMVHAFVSGGVGFHGLNRGVFAQMVPKGREAEFFGVYFVSIKAFSWVGPLACGVLNEVTGSLRTAILSALLFYVPAIVVLAFTDFDEAQREAEAASHTPRQKGGPMTAGAPTEQSGVLHHAGARERLLPPTATYGTAASCPPAFSDIA